MTASALGANPFVATQNASPTVLGVASSFVPIIAAGVKTVSSADYAVLTTDGFYAINVTTGASQRTISLPAAASNAGRYLTITKVDNGVGTVLIDPNASETINGSLTNVLNAQFSYVTIYCDGTGWTVTAVYDAFESHNGSFTSFTTSAQYLDVANFPISPGGWELSAILNANTNGGNISSFTLAIGTTVGNSGAGTVNGFSSIDGLPPTTTANSPVTIAKFPVAVTTVTPHYLKAYANYTTTAPRFYYSYAARRVI